MRIQHVASLLLGLSLALPLSAQEGALTVERALDIARSRSPLTAVAGARRRIAEGRARVDGAFPNPVAEWRHENLNSELQPDVFGTLQVPLDITGRRLALRSAVGAAVLRGRADSTSAMRQLEGDVVRAYWRAALAKELWEVAREERTARAALAQFDEIRFREGAVAEAVAMRTRLESDRARMSEATARAEHERARGDLARALGMQADELPAVAPIEPPGALPPAPAVATAVERALASRPDLRALRHASDESGHRLSGERRGIISDLHVVAGYKSTTGINTSVVGLLVPLPLFNRNEGARERAQGEAQLADAELRDAELRVRGEVMAALQGYEAIRDAMREGASGIDTRAAEVARIAEGAYREGAISLVELIEAQRARAESRASALRWAVDARLAMLDINRAIGAPILDPLETQ